jgi:hypothetical protein
VVDIVSIDKFKQGLNSAMTSPHDLVCARRFDGTYVRNSLGAPSYNRACCQYKIGATWISAAHVLQTTQMKPFSTSHTNHFIRSLEESLFSSSSKSFQCSCLLDISADDHQGAMNMMVWSLRNARFLVCCYSTMSRQMLETMQRMKGVRPQLGSVEPRLTIQPSFHGLSSAYIWR